MSPQPVVELLLASVAVVGVLLGVERSVRPGQRVHLIFHLVTTAGETSVRTVLASNQSIYEKNGLPVVVEVGHLPAVLLVIVVVRVSRVVGRCDALGVRRGCSVVKVDLGETARFRRST